MIMKKYKKTNNSYKKAIKSYEKLEKTMKIKKNVPILSFYRFS